MDASSATILNSGRCCCDPFNVHKKEIKKNLRNVTKNLIEKHPNLKFEVYNKLCSNCRQKLTKDKSEEGSSSSQSLHSSPEVESAQHEVDNDGAEMEYEVSEINKSLVSLEETPIKLSKLSSKPSYAKKKLCKVTTAFKRKLEQATGQPITDSDTDNTEIEILQQLKEKFIEESTSRSEKLSILTILPKSWPITRIMKEFNCSNFMARQAKNLAKEKGVFSTPNVRLGKRLDSEHVSIVIDFYHSADVSREMPGMKDCVSVKGVDGTREKKQKFLILCNLKEAYQLFKEKYPDIKIGFSKFAELRPKECVLPGSSGTHVVCLCTIHQNVKLMLAAIVNIFKWETPCLLDSPGTSTEISEIDTNYICHYSHCLAFLQCNPPQELCFFGKCDNCPKEEKLVHLLNNAFDRKGVDEIEFKEWVSTDRSTLQTQKLVVEEFIQLFYEKLKVLLQHDFIAKRQMAFLQELKEKLGQGEMLVIGDFSENYSFIVQDAAQSFHWNNCQATIHPYVIYYRQDNKLMHKSFVAISECNQHDVIAVNLFQTRLIEFLKLSHQITKIFYFSDGCAGQYKNRKNFLNLSYHQEDFKVDAEWHFFATSHGKGPCDGIGGSVKRLASRASLQRTGNDDHILDAFALYKFAVKTLTSIAFTFTTMEDHEKHREKLDKRLSYSRTIPGKSINL